MQFTARATFNSHRETKKTKDTNVSELSSLLIEPKERIEVEKKNCAGLFFKIKTFDKLWI